MSNDAIARLLDEAEIRDVVISLHRAGDEQDWARLETVYASDFTLLDVDPPVRGGSTMIAAQKARAAAEGSIRSQHVLGNVSVLSVEGDKAEAVAFQTVYRYDSAGMGEALSKAGTRNLYRLRREAGGWRVQGVSISPLWLEGQPVH